MDKAENYYEITDKYINNELSQKGSADFENEMEQNPDLYHQYQLQKENIKHIKEYRFNAIKQRLNNIDISYVQPSLLESTAAKLIGTAGGVVIIAASTYFGFFHDNTPIEEEQINVLTEEVATNSSNSIVSIDYKGKNEDKNDGNTSLSSSPIDTRMKESPTNIGKPELTKSNNTKVILKDSLGQELIIDKNKNVSPPNSFDKMVHPSNLANNIDAESTIKNDNFEAKKSSFASDIIESVTFKKDSKYKFHYQFIDGKLVLYGNFAHLYKIFDIRYSKNKREFYLRYNKNYFHLDKNVKEPTLLKNVSKDTLDIIRTQLSR